MSPIVFTNFATINEILFNFVFKIQGEQLFSWIDKEGLEHAMTLPDSVCDNNDPIWKVDTLEVSEKSQLPIKSLKYGPLDQGNLSKGIDNNTVRR